MSYSVDIQTFTSEMYLPFHAPELCQTIDYIKNLRAYLIRNVSAFCNFPYTLLGKYIFKIVLRLINASEWTRNYTV
jgi:DNA phosphorothioation-dependent restriction protein DptG